MVRLKLYIPVAIFMTSFAVALLFTLNSQWLFGGYEGLLYHSLIPIADEEVFSVRGGVTLVPKSGDGFSDLIAMDIIFSGDYDRAGDLGQIDFEIVVPGSVEGMVIASLIRDGDQLMLLPQEGGEPVDLSDLLKGSSSEIDFEGLWDRVYSQMTVTEREAVDPRQGGGLIPKPVVVYELDLMSLMTEEELSELGGLFGDIDPLPLYMGILVDRQGELVSMTMETAMGGMTLDGYCLFE